MPIEFLLAIRFLRGSRTEKNISFMIKICFITIFLSTFILTLVATIMSGFERETHKKLQSIHSDIIIKTPHRALNYPALQAVLKHEFSQSLAAWSPSTAGQVIMRIKNKQSDTQYAVILKAIDPRTEPLVSSLHTMLIPELSEPQKNLQTQAATNTLNILTQKNTVIIGSVRAKNSSLKPGDSIELLFPAQQTHADASQKIILENRIVTIGGIFKTGIEEFDEHMVYCSLEFMEELLNAQITEVNIKLKNNVNEQIVLAQLKKRIPLTIISWKELYPALVSALALEKYVVTIILALLILLASINIVALLFMFITHKQTDIALLKTMGIPLARINRIFIILGLLITISASISGLLCALLAATLLAYYPIPLPATYNAYVINYLPIYINSTTIACILAIILVLSFFALIIPTRRIKYMSPLAGLKRV